MNLDSLLPWLVTALLLSVRLSVAVAMAPGFGTHVPGLIRLVLTFGIASIAATQMLDAGKAMNLALQPIQLIVALAAEVVIGSLLGLGVHVVLGAFAFAGRLMDIQIGFGIGSIFDPVTRASANVLASMMGVLGMTLLFLTDAHLELAAMVAQSVTVLPLGELPELGDPLRPLLAVGALFSLGLALAAPVALALVLVDLAVGVAARNLPQVNVLMLLLPAKVLVGYFMLAITVTGWSPVIRQGFSMLGDLLGSRR